MELNWDVLTHALDIAPPDYHLFHFLQNSLAARTFTPDDNVKAYPGDFF